MELVSSKHEFLKKRLYEEGVFRISTKEHGDMRHKPRSFFSTLLLYFLVISSITALLLATFLTANYLSTFASSTENYNKQLQSQTNFAIDQLNESVKNLSGALLRNNKVRGYLSLNDIRSLTPFSASQELRKLLSVLTRHVESVYLYNGKLDLVYTSNDGHQQKLDTMDDPELEACLRDRKFLANHYGKPVPSRRDPETGAAEIIRYYYAEAYSRDEAMPNVIVINIRTTALTDSLRSMQWLSEDSSSSIFLFDEQHNYIASILDPQQAADSQWLEEVFTLSQSLSGTGAEYRRIGGARYYEVHTSENTYGWTLLTLIPPKVIWMDVAPANLLSLLIILVVLIVSFCACHYMARKLNTPIEALLHSIDKKRVQNPDYVISAPQEIQTILSAFSSLQENYQKIATLQSKTRYSLTQSYLRGLVLNLNQDPPKTRLERLASFNLQYLAEERLCMALLKIDDYHTFLRTHDPNELWGIRFSVVNIVTELGSNNFQCSAFSMDNDKFLLLMVNKPRDPNAGFESTMLETFHSIQKNLEEYLHFTVSIAYSSIFHGLEQFPHVYKNVEAAMLEKMRFGHNCIIPPYRQDEVFDEPFQFSYRTVLQITDELAAGHFDAAWAVYRQATEMLFFYDYSEITASMIHLAYSIYERISEKFPMLRDTLTGCMKTFHLNLRHAEISDDIQSLAAEFLQSICAEIQKLRQDPGCQNSTLISEKVIQLIEEEYASPSLCLTSLAEEVGLSANYLGRLFKQQTKKSVSQYIQDFRMEKVAYYLKTTNLPLNLILDKVGLEKSNYFYTRFKNYFGISLNEFRQQISSSD